MKQAQTNSNDKPDWEIGNLYKRSFDIVKNFKVLWLFGATIAGAVSFSGFDSASRLSNLSSSKNSKYDSGYKFFQDLFNSPSTNKTLGDATSYFSELLKYLFSQIPTWVYLILGFEIFALVIIGIILSLVSNSWAIGSLLSGIELAEDNKTVSIEEASKPTFKTIKPLMWLTFVPSFVLNITFIVLTLITIAGISLGQGPLKIVSVLLLIVFSIAYSILSAFLGLSKIWGEREIVLSNKSGKKALFDGYKIVKKKFWAMILLGLVNTVFSFLILGSIIAVFAGLFLGGIFNVDNNSALSISFFGIGGIFLVIFIVLSPLLSGIIYAFKASVWSLAYKNIKGKYDTK